MQNREDSLAKISKGLMFDEPFYGLLLLMLNKVWRKDMPTAGVSKNGINFQLAIGEDYWNSLTDPYKKGLLKHELLHIALFHLMLRDSYTDLKLYNIAADMEINQYINSDWLPTSDISIEEYEVKYIPIFKKLSDDFKSGVITKEKYREEELKLPSRGILIRDFENLNLDKKAGTDYYYKKLKEAREKGTSPLLDSIVNGMGSIGEPDHSTWQEFNGMSESEAKVMQKQAEYTIKNAIEEIQKSRGNIPGELSELINRLLNPEPSKFDWKGYLRMFAGGSRKVYTKKTRRKESNRFRGNPGLRIKQKKHILVGVDTSGSVSTEELIEFFNEIDHIYKTGAEVTVVQCDTSISSISSYRKEDELKIHGRGGTSFDPVVNYYNEHSSSFSCLIYLTDGEAPAPVENPKGRTLWVLSSRSKMTDHLPGSTIKLN